MANTFYGLTIGKTGLYAYQAAMNTAAHNASNIDTEGYSRQETIRQAENPLSLSSKYGMMGSGVVVTGIKSIRDVYYDSKYRYNNAILANQDTKAYYLDTLQSYFSEVNADGATASMDDFFTSLNSLANDVSNTTIRTEVTTQARTFTESINYLYDSLQRTQIEINQEIKTIAGQINAYAQELSAITRQINTYEVRGDNANDLRDQRELIVDKLSEFANVSVSEVVTDHSVNQYIVKLDGAVLVDTYEYYTLEVTAPTTSVNSNDVSGLYELTWSSGQAFASQSATLGGKLQSLFELRDGNNNKNFNGEAGFKVDADGKLLTGETDVNGELVSNKKIITVTGANIQNIAELNIPQEDGLITIGNREYEYDSFVAEYVTNADGTGEYVYTFVLKEELTDGDVASAETYAKLNDGINFKIGSEVDYKGIPYYMAQINEFVRTFAMNFNELHKKGKDLYGDCNGIGFFTGTYAGNGKELTLDGSTKTGEATYYYLNAGNFKVADEIMNDVKKIACGEYDDETNGGIEDSGILKQLMELQTDVTMFKQGTPSSYLESLTAVLGVSGQEAEAFVARQEAILATAEQQRYSISGVDQDEEAMNLTRFQNAYNLCSKVISTMNEIYDKLINETGV